MDIPNKTTLPHLLSSTGESFDDILAYFQANEIDPTDYEDIYDDEKSILIKEKLPKNNDYNNFIKFLQQQQKNVPNTNAATISGLFERTNRAGEQFKYDFIVFLDCCDDVSLFLKAYSYQEQEEIVVQAIQHKTFIITLLEHIYHSRSHIENYLKVNHSEIYHQYNTILEKVSKYYLPFSIARDELEDEVTNLIDRINTETKISEQIKNKTNIKDGLLYLLTMIIPITKKIAIVKETDWTIDGTLEKQGESFRYDGKNYVNNTSDIQTKNQKNTGEFFLYTKQIQQIDARKSPHNEALHDRREINSKGVCYHSPLLLLTDLIAPLTVKAVLQISDEDRERYRENNVFCTFQIESIPGFDDFCQKQQTIYAIDAKLLHNAYIEKVVCTNILTHTAQNISFLLTQILIDQTINLSYVNIQLGNIKQERDIIYSHKHTIKAIQDKTGLSHIFYVNSAYKGNIYIDNSIDKDAASYSNNTLQDTPYYLQVNRKKLLQLMYHRPFHEEIIDIAGGAFMVGNFMINLQPYNYPKIKHLMVTDLSSAQLMDAAIQMASIQKRYTTEKLTPPKISLPQVKEGDFSIAKRENPEQKRSHLCSGFVFNIGSLRDVQPRYDFYREIWENMEVGDNFIFDFPIWHTIHDIQEFGEILFADTHSILDLLEHYQHLDTKDSQVSTLQMLHYLKTSARTWKNPEIRLDRDNQYSTINIRDEFYYRYLLHQESIRKNIYESNTPFHIACLQSTGIAVTESDQTILRNPLEYRIEIDITLPNDLDPTTITLPESFYKMYGIPKKIETLDVQGDSIPKGTKFPLHRTMAFPEQVITPETKKFFVDQMKCADFKIIHCLGLNFYVITK